MQACATIERRRFGRRSCRVHGWIRTARRKRVPCIMTDYSQGGARLDIIDTGVVPRCFTLSFDGLGTDIYCEVRHEGSDAIGVEFARRRGQKPEDATAAVDALLKWLA